MKKLFGKINDVPVYSFSIGNGQISAEILTYGATLKSLFVKDKNGKELDVVLGYNTLEEYVERSYYAGAIVGRVANRIANARFMLNGKEYNLSKNNGEHALHGGFNGFSKKIWEVVDFGDYFVTLKHFSLDGEEGYPNNVAVLVTYLITNNELQIIYDATSDGDTILGLTNHAYFNLNGENGDNVFDTLLSIDANSVVLVNAQRVADGTLLDVENTVFDFRKEREIGNILTSTDKYILEFKGYDICYALNGKGYRTIAKATSKKSGISMETITDADGVQLYVANHFKGKKGKNCTYEDGACFCLETGRYPNAINCKNFPSPILKKGVPYTSKTTYSNNKIIFII
ncbi:MAG: galactose mutarotase, partial [Clostridia bacterium]|nr:galactose mutarotase [Clostridia bacterium]